MLSGITIEDVFQTYVVVLGCALVVSLIRGLYLLYLMRSPRRRSKVRCAKCR